MVKFKQFWDIKNHFKKPWVRSAESQMQVLQSRTNTLKPRDYEQLGQFGIFSWFLREFER